MEEAIAHTTPSRGWFAWYGRVPLYLKILVGLILGVLAGLVVPKSVAAALNVPAMIVLRLLGAIAPPLILVAVVRALLGANVRGRLAGKMFGLLVLNTLVAILIGLTVANLVKPGRHASLPPGEAPKVPPDPIGLLLDNVPGSLVAPFV